MTYDLPAGGEIHLHFRSGMEVCLTVKTARPDEILRVECHEIEYGADDGLVDDIKLQRLVLERS